MTEQKIISAIAKKYADALTQTALSSGSADYFLTQMNEVEEVLKSSQDLNVVMKNSSIKTAKKIEIIQEIFGGKINPKLLNFLKILVEKDRFSDFDGIKEAYIENIKRSKNIKTVEITSPVELNSENRSNILSKLEHKLNCEVEPVWQTDTSLIAGLKFKIDDCVIDTSVKTKLENLSKNINR